jgi:hypothetical protein
LPGLGDLHVRFNTTRASGISTSRAKYNAATVAKTVDIRPSFRQVVSFPSRAKTVTALPPRQQANHHAHASGNEYRPVSRRGRLALRLDFRLNQRFFRFFSLIHEFLGSALMPGACAPGGDE